jgi:hypothetical protein
MVDLWESRWKVGRAPHGKPASDFTVILVVTTMVPLVDRGGPIHLAGMLLAAIFFLYQGIRLARSTSTGLPSRVVHASVLYLPMVLFLIVARKA